MNLETLTKKAWELIATIPDPEIPVINVIELGIVRDVKITESETLITITPTYSGCPAMQVIEDDVKALLVQNGFLNVKVDLVYSPAWTTDWITEEAKAKLFKYGISPPEHSTADKKSLLARGERIVKCPQCGSLNTVMTSQFGSTACKSLYKCNDCLEPFDYFKCI